MKKATENTEVKLTPREEKFCREYVLCLNVAKAAVSAGYSPKAARQLGHRVITKDYIKNRIEYLKANLAETAEISALRVIKEHEKIAFANSGQLRDGWMSLKDYEQLTEDQKSIIQEVTTKDTKYGTEVKIKLYDKQKSLDSITAMLGFNAPEKKELTGKDGKDLFMGKTVEELESELKNIVAKLND